MKKHKTIKRLSALALILALALASAAPVRAAARQYQVRIHPNDFTHTPASASDSLMAGRFHAYQIFEGGIDDDKYVEGIGDPSIGQLPNKQPVANALSEAKWGSGIQEKKIPDLLKTLIMEPTYVKDMTFPNASQLVTRILGGRDTYVQTPGLKEYWDEYNKPEYWEPPKGGSDPMVGGALTAAGEEKLRGILDGIVAEGKLTFGDLLAGALKWEKYEVTEDGDVSVPSDKTGVISYLSSAEMAMRVLTDFTNTERPYSRELADDFARKVSAKDGGGAYQYLSSSPSFTSTWSEADKCWQIDLGDKGGFYFIIDTYATHAAESGYDPESSDNDKAQSDFIVAVFGSQDICVKTFAPTANKVIVTDGGEIRGADFEIGETVAFRITGTLPENYDNYRTYRYEFTDALPKGLSYQEGSMTVSAVNPDGEAHPITAGVTIDGFTGTPSVAAIKFADLKQVNGGTLDITADWKIVVEYEAALNKQAVFENVTDVYLTYSSSSVNSGAAANTTRAVGDVYTANTTRAVNYIYTYGIDVLKYSEDFVENIEDGDPTNPLEGAGFALVKGGEYAVFEDDGTLCGWIAKDALGGDDIVWASVADSDGKLTTTDYAGKHIYFITGPDGKLNASGLRGFKAGTNYALREIIVPDGYDKLESDTIVRFDAEYVGGEAGESVSPGKMKDLSYLDDGSKTYIMRESEFTDEFSENDTLARLKLINYPNNALLDTGGPGTALFYIAGGALLTGAAGILIFSHTKKNRKNGKRVRYINIQK